MPGWLTKAAGALRGEQPEQPDPFETECACGVRHSGLRRRRPQRIICRQCGTALFVLARDPYPRPLAPEPAPKKSGSKRKKKKDRKRMAAVPPDAPPRFEQVATNVYQASDKKVAREPVAAGPGFGARVGAWLFAFLALWTPLRLILTGCVAVCAATVAYTLLVDRSEQAVVDLKAANEAARKALAERNIDVAFDELTAAVAALDKLDRHDDPLASEIRQLHREATALHAVLPISPLQVVSEADAAHESGQGAQWQQMFEAQYRNRWLIVDGMVHRGAAESAGSEYSVLLPLRFGPQRRGVTMQAALPDLDALANGTGPRAAIFAVQIVGCDLSADKQMWRLRTSSDSAFLWGTLDNYLAAGFAPQTPEDRREVELVLAAQQRVLGLSGTETALSDAGSTAAAEGKERTE